VFFSRSKAHNERCIDNNLKNNQLLTVIKQI